MTIDKISRQELIHHRLQAILREHTFCDFSYVGLLNGEHYYNIDGNIVPLDRIQNIEKTQ
jgi:hypothetical protein